MLNSDHLNNYRNDGYAIVRDVFTSADLAQMHSACDDFERQALDFTADTFVGVTFFNMHRDVNPFATDVQAAPVTAGQIRRVTYPYALSNILDRYRAHPKLLAAVSAILGPDLKQIVNQVNFNPPGSGAGWGWHQDYRFRKPGIANMVQDFVQTITALDLCSTFTGGIRLVPRSHLLGDLRLDLDNEHAESHFDPTLAITPELSPGDVIFFNSHIIHGSSANRSPHKRRVYINGYARATATVGMPVLKAGASVTERTGRMEYEGDQESLPKASKY